MLSRRERDRSLSHRRLVRAAAGDDYTVRLFNPYVSSIVGEKLFPKELDELSNVIKGHRARLGSMREKHDHKKQLSRQRAASGRTRLRTLSSFSGKKLGTGADRYRSLRQGTRRDHHQGCTPLAQAPQIPKIVDASSPASLRHTLQKNQPPFHASTRLKFCKSAA